MFSFVINLMFIIYPAFFSTSFNGKWLNLKIHQTKPFEVISARLPKLPSCDIVSHDTVITWCTENLNEVTTDIVWTGHVMCEFRPESLKEVTRLTCILRVISQAYDWL